MKLRNFLNLKFVTKLQKLPHGCEKNRLILNLQFRVQKWQAWCIIGYIIVINLFILEILIVLNKVHI